MDRHIKLTIIIIADLLVVLGGVYISFILRLGTITPILTSEGLLNLGVFTFFTLLGFYMNDLYNLKALANRKAHFRKILLTVVSVGLTFVVIQFFTRSLFLIKSRAIILGIALFQVGGFLGMRVYFIPFILGVLHDWNLVNRSHLLVISEDKQDKQEKFVKRYIEKKSFLGYNPLSMVASDFYELEINEIKDILKKNNIEEMFYESGADSFRELHDEIERILKCIDKVTIRSELFKELPSDFTGTWDKIEGLPIIEFKKKKRSRFTTILGGIFNKLIALLSLIVLFPIFVLISFLIKLTSKGPIFFKQKRMGFKKEQFECFKFRSMAGKEDTSEREENYRESYVENDKDGAAEEETNHKIVNEKRVTYIGKILRKLSLDEFPQLFNVLLGDMSLVGPRPYVAYEVEHFSDWHKKRFNVKPGLTGVWQVYGRSTVPFEVAMFLDYCYLVNKSFRLDMFLIFKTLPILIFGTGGY